MLRCGEGAKLPVAYHRNCEYAHADSRAHTHTLQGAMTMQWTYTHNEFHTHNRHVPQRTTFRPLSPATNIWQKLVSTPSPEEPSPCA